MAPLHCDSLLGSAWKCDLEPDPDEVFVHELCEEIYELLDELPDVQVDPRRRN